VRKSLAGTGSSEYVFLSLKGYKFSRSKNYHNGLLNMGYKSTWVEIDPHNKFSQLLDCKKQYIEKNTTFVVASPSHILALYARLVLLQKIHLDAGWPLSDGVVLSRREYGFMGFKALLIYLLDFFAFHSSSMIFLESSTQVRSVRTKFLLSRKKLVVLETGFDENRAKNRNGAPLVAKRFTTLLFRGGAQQEAGLSVLTEAIELLKHRKDIRFIVACKGFKIDTKDLANITIYDEYLSDLELWKLYGQADVVLGQLSKHSRLKRTLPHKLFEAGYFKKCYLTSNVGAISEFVDKGLVFGFTGGSSQSLVGAINELVDKKNTRAALGRELGEFYIENFSQKILTIKLVNNLVG
jgi:glycosyltransferase involved in cell wall biosynthesis